MYLGNIAKVYNIKLLSITLHHNASRASFLSRSRASALPWLNKRKMPEKVPLSPPFGYKNDNTLTLVQTGAPARLGSTLYIPDKPKLDLVVSPQPTNQHLPTNYISLVLVHFKNPKAGGYVWPPPPPHELPPMPWSSLSEIPRPGPL